MARYLITGANGLVGQGLIRKAIAEKPETGFIAISNDPEKLAEKLGGFSQITYASWDQAEEIAAAGADGVVHCAFARKEDGGELHKSLELTGRILRIAARDRLPVISISSRSIYGQTEDLPWTEETPVAPNSLYALAKDAEEMLTSQAGEMGGFPYTNVRLAGLVGIGMDARILSKMVKSALETGAIKIVGGDQLFAMLDIRDAAAGLWALLQVPPERRRRVYNLGSERAVPLREIAEIIARVSRERYGRRIRITREARNVTLLDGMDCRPFYEDTGWRPAYALEDTVAQLFEYYIQQNS